MDIEDSEAKALKDQKFLKTVRIMMIETHRESNAKDVYCILKKKEFKVELWKSSNYKVFRNILIHFGDLIN